MSTPGTAPNSEARKRATETAHHIHPDPAARALIERERRAAAVEALREAVADITTHNGTPVTPTNLRWAATHEALCRSFIFDVLTGLADRLAVEGDS
jgi:hypothetical protein